MPPSRNAAKRTLEEIVALEDPEDDDYDDRAPAPSRSRPNRARNTARPPKKRQRGDYRGSDVDSDDEDIEEDDDRSFDEGDSEEEEVETNDKGRPVRRTVKKAVKYEEPDSDASDELVDPISEDEDGEPDLVVPRSRRSLVVKLKTNDPSAMSRTLRSRDPAPTNRPPSSSAPTGTRRSSRLSHDEEDLLALTNSGRHVEVARTGSREPDQRPTRGGKGLKHPSKSTIDEETEESPMKRDDDEMEIAQSQEEILDSVRASQVEMEDDEPRLTSDLPLVVHQDGNDDGHETADPLQESEPDARVPDDEDEDEGPINRGRLTRGSIKRKAESPPLEEGPGAVRKRLRARGRSQRASRKRAQDESSDFDPENEGENDDQMSSSGGSEASPRKSQRDDYESSNGGRRSTRSRRKPASAQLSVHSDEEEELAAELADLQKDTKKKRASKEEILFESRGRRGGKKPDYNLLRNLTNIEDDEEAVAAPSPSARARKPGAGSWQRSLFNTYGPFGGGGAAAPVLGGPSGYRAQGDVDSDSSDDEVMKKPRPVGGLAGMTPTQPTPGGFNPFAVQPLNSDPLQTAGGTPANLGKIKDKQALADADPLGVDQNVNFDSVGGLQGHIDQLKEMVSLPLLYPEIFMRFKITPPRGVLFHGPPGTGKTLLARALASTVSSQGRKVTFYMRKGADALSKWVGEAERQLRLLFEEARKNQPSIIFFDEIDGLAPVRSSKQEQIHASIVSTLLALMDGMDGRGQVIVIGATNRPDSVDPALRRPGRFDREFYFPLPNTEARRAILDIHTRGWNPPLDPQIKDELAEITKGYGGADLRALCTEAALNAVQRRYPQIYKATEKLVIDPKTIEVTPKDFMISVKKMVPSSERSTTSGAAPLPASIAPLLLRQVAEIERIIAEVLPQKKKSTALQEAEYEDTADGYGFGREKMQQAFETSRVFRPRLLIHGKFGMGQQYVASALLHHFEGLHVQNFDLQTLLSDSTSSAESTVIRLFSEVKMHKPSVIYISNITEWLRAVGDSVISTFFGLLRSIKPTDPILVLGLLEEDDDQDQLDKGFRKELFGYSRRNQYRLEAPTGDERRQFFEALKEYVRTSPSDFPDPTHRKKRHLEVLRIAPPEPEKPPTPPTKEELKAQKKRDRQTLNLLKIRLQPIMDQIRIKYKKFRSGIIDESQIRYLYDEADPGTVTSDLHTEMLATASFRPFEIGRDAHEVPGLVDQANGRFYYNLESVTIEKRLSNGYYKRPKDFLADIKRLAKDAKTAGDEDRLLKANEMLTNVEVDISSIEMVEPGLVVECEKVYQRELAREKEMLEKAKATNDGRDMPPPQAISNVPHNQSSGPSAIVSDGPILLGEPVPTAKDLLSRLAPVTPSRPATSSSNITNGIRAIEGPPLNGSGVYNSTDSGNQADAEHDSHIDGANDSNPSSNQRSNETQRTHTTSSFGNRESAQPRPYHSYTAPSQQLRRETGMSEPLSQTDFMTPMQPGSTAADYANEASTTQTTSGKKTSSGEKDREREQNNTQESGPNLYLFGERRSADGSEVPDTQSDQNSNGPSQPVNIHSQALIHPHSSQGTDPNRSQPRAPTATITATNQLTHPHPRANGHLVDLLNPEPQSNLIQADEGSLDRMVLEIADRTSGMTVEQLEQINSTLMDTLWKTRGEWNRRRVLDNVIESFNQVTEDMVEMNQEFGSSSWGRIVNG